MFVDRVRVKVKGGRGGDGCAAFRREKYVPFGGPSGGDGGNGGCVIMRATAGEQSLVDLYFAPHQEAKNGESGHGKDQYGAVGHDKVIRVPLGTVVRDAETGEMLADLCLEGQEFMAAQGGRGGRGNRHFKTSTNQAPRQHEPGQKGEERTLELILKSVADVGLVGYPNAGKSTIIGDVSNAHPKTAAYPFTTLHPVVGLVEFPDYYRFSMADIPGLIDGAHDNVGLGHDFLRHIERCKLLIYVIDTAGVDGRKPWDDLAALARELELYLPGLSQRATLVVANKMDLPEAAENLAELRQHTSLPILPISALEKTHLDDLLQELRRALQAGATAAPSA